MLKQIKGPVFNIPDNMLKAYTMNGMARIKVNWYYGDTSADTLIWDIPLYRHLKKIVHEAVRLEGNVYYSTDHFLPTIFRKYPVKGNTVAVIGSATPLYEAYLQYFGAKPLTIEYRPIRNSIKSINTLTYDQAVMEVDSHKLKVDAAFSYSSIEHSGLGRYGDILNPEGDIETMNMIKQLVKPGGLFFLQIPVGKDMLIWNSTRIYGQFRLLLLLEGWELLETFAYTPNLLSRKGDEGSDVILVLKNSTNETSKKQLFDSSMLDSFSVIEANRSEWQKNIVNLSKHFHLKPALSARATVSVPNRDNINSLFVRKIMQIIHYLTGS